MYAVRVEGQPTVLAGPPEEQFNTATEALEACEADIEALSRVPPRFMRQVGIILANAGQATLSDFRDHNCVDEKGTPLDDIDEVALACIGRDEFEYYKVSNRLLDDPKFADEATSTNKELLKYSPVYQRSPYLFFKALKEEPTIIGTMPESVLNDPELRKRAYRQAIEQDPQLAVQAEEKIKEEGPEFFQEVAKLAVSKDVRHLEALKALGYLEEEAIPREEEAIPRKEEVEANFHAGWLELLQRDGREVQSYLQQAKLRGIEPSQDNLRAAMKEDPSAFSFLGEEARNNEEFARMALKSSLVNINYVGPRIIKNLVLELIDTNPQFNIGYLLMAHIDLADDFDVVLAFLKSDKDWEPTLQHAGVKVHEFREIAEAAMERAPVALLRLHRPLLFKDLILHAVEKNPEMVLDDGMLLIYRLESDFAKELYLLAASKITIEEKKLPVILQSDKKFMEQFKGKSQRSIFSYCLDPIWWCLGSIWNGIKGCFGY